MRVILESPYGIGAGVSRMVADSDHLASDRSSELARLAGAARAEKPSAPAGRAADRIRIEDAGGSVELSQSVTAMSPAFAALRSFVREHGKRAG